MIVPAPQHIVIAAPEYRPGLDRLRAIAGDARIDVVGNGTTAGEVLDPDLRSATVWFGDAPPADVAAWHELRLLQLTSAGFGQVIGMDLPPGVTVANASGVNDIPIAEWCVMMMLALRRDLPGMLSRQQQGQWERPARFQAELRGLRVGIIGFGSIGQEFARLAQALGLQICVLTRGTPGFRPDRYDPFDRPPDSVPVPDAAFTWSDRDEFLRTLDVLVLTLPLTTATTGLIDGSALAVLPKHAILINPARAGIVDEAALRDALVSGSLAGAALDVHYRTPMPPDDPTWTLPNTIVSPHISGSTQSTFCEQRLWDLLCRNVSRLRDGRPPLNRIVPSDLRG